MIRASFFLAIVCLSLGSRRVVGFSFVPSRSRLATTGLYVAGRRNSKERSLITIRDHSASYWFSPGDRIEVVEDVTKAGCNLKGMVGVVIEAWQKCEVDPTCCCVRSRWNLIWQFESSFWEQKLMRMKKAGLNFALTKMNFRKPQMSSPFHSTACLVKHSNSSN